MGISRLTVLMIQNNEVKVSPYHAPNGKWAGRIFMMKNGMEHCILISTTDIFDTEEAAVQNMEDLIKEVRNIQI